MADQYHFFHASCLREEIITAGPGDLMVCLREAISLKARHPESTEGIPLHLEVGSILYAATGLTNVRHAVDEHLRGSVSDSELRFGVGIVLGFEPSMRHMAALPSDQEQHIDDWIDRYTSFIVEVGDLDDFVDGGQGQAGFFNGIRRHWQLDWGPPPICH